MNAAVKRLSTIDREIRSERGYLCFPPAGGTVLGLRGLAHASSGAEVWAVEYPGHGDRLAQPPAESLEELAEEIALESLGRFEDEGFSRIALIGFSMGAFVALEVALRLQTRGRTAPAALVVVGVCAPQRRIPGKYADSTEGGFLDGIGHHHSPELRAYALELFLADLRLTTAYSGPAPETLSCPIIAIRGEADPAFAAGADSLRAWRAWTSGWFIDCVVPGAHLGVLAPGREAGFWHLIRRVLFDMEPGDE
ncbi:thioesterase II family protein [Amycolatopsis sp. NPDC102389]|uniref:thioesterase II family protein n=1 Tax=Amycolatopsis sp. NPDC102389 TaxID=3363941 RepID=UPI00382B923B